ncbi:hypothetical protein H6P81_020408 [Aristolochia fimbriata]|uniref:Neprosin activation peptide domain-containing protein n=1 Tax=Aristolochia fimbriata TaxID=158543 RepID=A0AAV7DUG6_ARIFI|nr:hypothetical protein H6P81_020408 [Aristolochia fimbriata]
MEAIHLLILDECHHGVKEHPYSLVMSEFYHTTVKDKRPAVFGMTASLVSLKGVSSQEDCAIKIRNHEIKDHKELEKHVPMPSVVVVEYDKAANLCGVEEGGTSSEEEDVELERQLKILNNPAIKTINTEYGDIFDCVDIHKQPTFDHPSLKNHKIKVTMLVATSVAEEGLDLRQCNVVIRFGLAKMVLAYIQSRGVVDTQMCFDSLDYEAA